MSESSISVVAVSSRRSRLWMLVIPAVLLLLGLVYLSGYFVLPNMINSAFQENNCEAVLSRGDIYARFYSSTNDDVTAQVGECAVFVLGLTREQEKTWRDAYSAFTVYSGSYPQGRFRDEVHRHLASVLIGLAQEELRQQNHTAASSLIDRVLREYDDPSVVKEAESLKLELLMDWGTNLREAGDFAQAEQIFNDVLQSTLPYDQKTVQLALAQTYLAWGLGLQSQHQFGESRLLIDTAVSMDPDPQSNSGPAAQAKANQTEFYKQWGDYLVEQGDYANAMGLYATASSVSTDADPSVGQDIMSSGYVHWAEVLSSKEDFIGALVVLDLAESMAATDTARDSVENSRSDVYAAFSNSQGEQARQAMLDAAKIVCRHQAEPRLPIFGLDTENAGVVVNGADGTLPGNLAATTPGSMHYVACVEESATIVGATTHTVGSFVFSQTPPFHAVQVLFQAIQYDWAVSLKEVKTADKVESTVIHGSDPPPLPTETRAIYEGARAPRYFGEKPKFDDLVKWLDTVLQ